MEVESCVPPGFRFHPTEEELVGYYLRRKIASQKFDIEVISDIDLYKIEPWDLQDKCRLGYEEQKEWYFFSHKDKKYPSGTRTNRATTAGFWKATGRDKAILLSKSKLMIGMRKTLVFYEGRAPNGRKSDWIMHEYRLQSTEQGPPQEEGWVVCRAFKKQTPNPRTQCFSNYINPSYFLRDQYQYRETLQTDTSAGIAGGNFIRNESKENQNLFDIPHLIDSPAFSSSSNFMARDFYSFETGGVVVDWKNLDTLMGSSQLAESSTSCSNLNGLMNGLDYGLDDDDRNPAGENNCLPSFGDC